METEPERIRKILRDALDAALLERDTASEAFDEILRDIPSRLPQTHGASQIKSVENQLYRVEIHNPTGTSPTFKWSRDNGSVAVSWTGQNGNDLTVSSTGPDSVLGFAPGQWVELVDDVHELTFVPGTFVQLANVQGKTLTINPATATGSVNFADFPTTPKIRRWDSPGLVPLTTGSWLDLEDGVQVQFAAGATAPGDYWLICRTKVESSCSQADDPGPARESIHKSDGA